MPLEGRSWKVELSHHFRPNHFPLKFRCNPNQLTFEEVGTMKRGNGISFHVFQDSKPYFLSQLYIINTKASVSTELPSMHQNLTSGFDNLFLTFVVGGEGGRMGKRGELNQDVAFNPSEKLLV